MHLSKRFVGLMLGLLMVVAGCAQQPSQPQPNQIVSGTLVLHDNGCISTSSFGENMGLDIRLVPPVQIAMLDFERKKGLRPYIAKPKMGLWQVAGTAGDNVIMHGTVTLGAPVSEACAAKHVTRGVAEITALNRAG